MKDLSRLYVQRFEQRAAVHGLTLPQCKALVYLATNEGISQVQLAERTDIEPMSLVRILDRMESEGWSSGATTPRTGAPAACISNQRQSRWWMRSGAGGS